MQVTFSEELFVSFCNLFLKSKIPSFVSGPVYHSWQLLVVKSSINTVETAGLLSSLTGRTHDVSNKTGIINQVSRNKNYSKLPLKEFPKVLKVLKN